MFGDALRGRLQDGSPLRTRNHRACKHDRIPDKPERDRGDGREQAGTTPCQIGRTRMAFRGCLRQQRCASLLPRASRDLNRFLQPREYRGFCPLPRNPHQANESGAGPGAWLVPIRRRDNALRSPRHTGEPTNDRLDEHPIDSWRDPGGAEISAGSSPRFCAPEAFPSPLSDQFFASFVPVRIQTARKNSAMYSIFIAVGRF